MTPFVHILYLAVCCNMIAPFVHILYLAVCCNMIAPFVHILYLAVRCNMNYPPSCSHFLYCVHLLFAEVESETMGRGHSKGHHSFSLSLVLAHSFSSVGPSAPGWCADTNSNHCLLRECVVAPDLIWSCSWLNTKLLLTIRSCSWLNTKLLLT
jgi:hypothetical protein